MSKAVLFGLGSALPVGAVLGSVADAAAPTAGAEPAGRFDVQRFGAVGDGRADDTAAIQAAIDAAKAAGRGLVTLPAGIYRVTDTLLVDTHYIALQGAGMGATFITTDRDIPILQFGTGKIIYGCGAERLNLRTTFAGRTAKSKGLWLNACRNAAFRDIIIQSVYTGISIQGETDEVRFHGVTVKDASKIAPENGVHIDGATDNVVAAFLFFTDCSFHGCTSCGFRADGREFGDFMLSDCTFVSCGTGMLLNHTIPFVAGDYGADIQLVNCQFDSSKQNGILARGLTHLSVIGSWFSANAQEAIRVEDSAWVKVIGADVRQGESGITYVRCQQSVINGVTARLMKGAGLRLLGSEHCAVSGCSIDNVETGIAVEACDKGRRSAHNTLTGCSVKARGAGIREGAGHSPNVYTGLMIDASTPISDLRHSDISLFDARSNQTLHVRNGVLELWGAAPPAAGQFKAGDKVYNTSPMVGGYAGWVCTAAGGPGVWKGFGQVSQ